VTRFSFAVVVAAVMHSSVARSQPVTVEASQSAGYSTEEIAAVATQLRTFGEVTPARLRFNIEAAWGQRSADGSDVFGTAYPYEGPAAIIEGYGERTFLPGRALLGVKAGRYRTPFGISSASDHAYMGFMRAPLIRYDDYFALSNTFVEHGVDLVAGTPHLSLEASLGVPADVGESIRRPGLNTVVRGQTAFGPMIVGISHIRTQPYQNPRFAHGDAVFSGVDLRWMHDGVQARGEWIAGRPFDGTTTTGGYLDLIVHRPVMGPVTAVMRAERLVYDAAPPFELAAQRYSAGTRIRIVDQLAAQIALVHQSREIPQRRRTALDLAVTYSLRVRALDPW
jgi:hypothetical protein